MKFRWFPFLGFKTLTDDEKDAYDIPRQLTCKALTFEWLYLQIMLIGKVTSEGGANGN